MSGESYRDDWTIFVDADGCPVLDDVLEIVDDRPVVVVHNKHHQITVDTDNVTLKQTGDRQDAADHRIYNETSSGDLVITDDLGLAGIVLGKGARVLRFRGGRPTQDNIDLKLAMRDQAARARRASKRVSGPSEYTEDDRERFRSELKSILGDND